MSQKTYTFEDWISGKIEDDIQSEVTSDIPSSNRKNKVKYLFENGAISKNEFEKINNAKYYTFIEGASLTIDALYNKFTDTLEESNYPSELINLEIEEIDEKLKKYSKRQLKSALSGTWDSSGITFLKVIKLHSLKEQGGVLHISNPSPIPFPQKEDMSQEVILEMAKNFGQVMKGNSEEIINRDKFSKYVNSLVTNKLYDINVLKGYLSKLEGLKNNKSDDDNRSYGIHQDNKDWIIRTFEKVRPKFSSENKAVKKVKSLYRDEFGMKIGNNTIRRYNGLID